MKFERIIEGKDFLWAVRDMSKEVNELTELFRKWNDLEYLMDFFKENKQDLMKYFHVERISQAINDTLEDSEALQGLIFEMPYCENLDELFRPLGEMDKYATELAREKARNWLQKRHASWLRIYAIRLEPNVFVITGGAIKLTPAMQDRSHTLLELDKVNRCKHYLQAHHVFDKDSFLDTIND